MWLICELLAAQRRRSLRSTRHCKPIWRNDWLASSSLQAGFLFPARPCRGRAVGMDQGKTGGGHLPRMTGHGHEARVKNGPALAGHGAGAVREAVTRTIITLPEQLRRSLTWDQGAEMALHARLKIDAGMQVYFCDPHSPWQRGTNENTNGLLRQYFPKGTDLTMHGAVEIAAVAAALNSRPRKTLDWKTPAEALDQLLLSANKDSVATTA